MSLDALAGIERDIEAAKAAIELGEALQRFKQNRDFKTIIEQEYINKEAVRLVSAIADPAMQRTESQSLIQKQMIAVSYLNDYFRTLEWGARVAESNLRASEAEKDLIQEEGDE